MSLSIEYAASSEIGRVRRVNEDNLWCDGKFLKKDHVRTARPLTGRVKSKEACFGIFDGMGGEACGETASYLAAKAMDEWSAADPSIWGKLTCLGKEKEAQTGEKLARLGKDMNRTICDYAREHRIRSMGSTLAMLYADRKKVWVSNLGDSPVFRLHDGQLTKVSLDHVQPSFFSKKGDLTQYLGIPETELELEPYVAEFELCRGDMYLLCSDGLTDMVPAAELEKQLNACGSTQALDQTADDLTSLAMQRGGRDNITLILCRVGA